MKLYKVLVEGKSCHGGDLEWSLPKKGKPGEWHETKNARICSEGLHGTNDYIKWQKRDCEIYECEATPVEWDVDKFVTTRMRLLRKVRKPAWWRRVEELCEVLEKFPWFRPDGKPLSEWRLFEEDTWDAARDAAWNAAGDAAVALVAGSKLAKKHRDHLTARLGVWRKGYALLCDMNGMLYVYAQRIPGSPGEREGKR